MQSEANLHGNPPPLSASEADRERTPFLQNEQIQYFYFVPDQWPTLGIRPAGIPMCLLHVLGLEILVCVLIQVWLGLSLEPTEGVISKTSGVLSAGL